MKIYETIQQAKKSEITQFPGIYYFRNKINNKYYIGQAICIRKRFQSHCHQVQIKNNKYPIYKAITKYGEDNFEFGIIGVFKVTLEKDILKKKLDILETKYIKEYNSYGNTGYNQTLGGDGGIFGYKMTEEQKKHISENSKKVANDGRNTVYVYNIKEEKKYSFTSCQEAANHFSINRDALYSALRRETGTCYNNYLISRNLEELNILISSYKEKLKNKRKINWNSGMYENKYSIEEYINIKNENPTLSATKLSELLGVCKKTIYNYEKQLPNPTFKQREEIKYKIINIQTLEENIVNAKEGGKFFNLSSGQFRKTEKYCRDHSSIYKKKYKIIRLNNL